MLCIASITEAGYPDFKWLNWLFLSLRRWLPFFNGFWFFFFSISFSSSPLRAGSGTAQLVTGWERICLPSMKPESPVRNMEPPLSPSPIGANNNTQTTETHTKTSLCLVCASFLKAPVNLSRFEQAFANSLVFGRSGDSFWIGLHDQGSRGSFHWLSGDEVSYTNWNRDQPGRKHTSTRM